MLLTVPHWPSLSTLVHAIREGGEELSLPQASKAVRALEEELIVWKLGNAIALKEPSQLLDRLGEEWRPLSVKARQTYRLREKDIHWPMRLASDVGLNWSLTGTSSVSRYAVFSQGGPRQIAVSNLSRAAARLEGIPERVASFADVELIETEEPGAFFQCETDPTGLRWASRLQTWLDLQMGDARQQEAARDLRQQILSKVTP